MGFNPFRQHERNTTDVVIVVVTLLIVIGLVAWATFSG